MNPHQQLKEGPGGHSVVEFDLSTPSQVHATREQMDSFAALVKPVNGPGPSRNSLFRTRTGIPNRIWIRPVYPTGLLLYVSDSGPGLPEKNYENLQFLIKMRKKYIRTLISK